MTDTLTMVTMPALSSWPNVEIAQTGQWDISTGRVTLTTDDFANALAALECPAVRKPVLKLGHQEPAPDGNKKRWDGEPSLGYVDNMATAESGHTMVGDYTGMPGWLGAILPSAYPDRSMEATWDFVCQLGHVHPFVITAVSLLGVTPPGIGTLESLQDVATVYGVNASVPVRAGFSVSIQAKGVTTMPNPRPTEVAAGVTTEDVRRQYYDSGVAYTVWIKEMSLDPLQLITVDEATNEYARVPITLSDGGVTFGDPIPVEVEYVDTPTTAAASRMVYASKDESRAGFTSRVEKDLPPAKAIERVHKAATAATKGGTGMDPVQLREALGLAPDASDDDVSAAFATAFPTNTPPVVQPPAPVAATAITGTLPEGTVMVDSSIIRRLQEDAQKGVQAMAEIQKSRRDNIIAAAITDGKFPPSRREHYELMWDGDPVGTETHIKTLAAGIIPLGTASGYAGTETFESDQTYFGLYPEDLPNDGGKVGR
jgi:hypothetical protein